MISIFYFFFHAKGEQYPNSAFWVQTETPDTRRIIDVRVNRWSENLKTNKCSVYSGVPADLPFLSTEKTY